MLIKINSIKIRKSEFPSSHSRLFLFDGGSTHNLPLLLGADPRPYKIWKKNVVPSVLNKLELTPTDVVWSRTAGCSCGCSPGFILKGNTDSKRIYVDITYEDDSNETIHVVDMVERIDGINDM